jgi:hypothetical protein
MKWFWCTVVIVSLISTATASAQFYRYVDTHGNVTYTDDINQVPGNQRALIRSYAESQPTVSGAKEPLENTANTTSHENTSTGLFVTAANADTSGNGESLEAAKARLEETKKQLEAEYQVLVKEKEALVQEKDKRKTREEIHGYNKRVEAFNQRTGKYETVSKELQKQVAEYNARVTDENDNLLKKKAK